MEINIGILAAQIINFLIIFWVFKTFIGDKLAQSLVERREKLAKADDATRIYQETMAQAESEKKTLIEEAVAHKQRVIEEAKQSAEQKAATILDEAGKKAEYIMKTAEEKATKLEDELKESFVSGVKHTAQVVVKKLFDKDKVLQEEYLEGLVKEFAK